MTNEMLPLLADVIFCALLLGLFLGGWKKGFAGMFVHAFSGLLALGLAYLLAPYISGLAAETGLTDRLAARIGEALHLESLIPQAVGGEEGLISSLPLPDILKTALMRYNTDEVYQALGVSEIGAYLSSYLARIIINGICLLVIFLVGLIFFQWLARKLKIVNKIPLVGFINSLLGGVSGLVIALVIFAVICFVTTFLSSVNGIAQLIAGAISDSTVAGWFMRNDMGITFLVRVFH